MSGRGVARVAAVVEHDAMPTAGFGHREAAFVEGRHALGADSEDHAFAVGKQVRGTIRDQRQDCDVLGHLLAIFQDQERNIAFRV